MDFTFKSQLNNGSLEAALAVATFTKTNKKGYKSYIIEHSKEDTEYAFIKNNLIIRFDAIRGARMSYTNGPIAKKIEDRTRKEGDKKNINTISDF